LKLEPTHCTHCLAANEVWQPHKNEILSIAGPAPNNIWLGVILCPAFGQIYSTGATSVLDTNPIPNQQTKMAYSVPIDGKYLHI